MNLSLMRQTSSGFSQLSTHSHKKPIINEKIKTNPEEQIINSNPNEPLLKIILLDNGNPLKDCKALLDSIKEENSDDKEKLPLFYQDNLNQLLQNLKIDQISLRQNHVDRINKQIASKIKHFKLKKHNETFQNYSKLMTHSLRENQKMKFLKQSSKIHQSQEKSVLQLKKSSSRHKPRISSAKQVNGRSFTVLDRMMADKRKQIAIQCSSKINKEQSDLQQVMKNRFVCEKVLEQALMFERYFDIIKKQKQRIHEQNNQLTKNVKNQLSQKKTKDKRKYFGQSAVKKLQNPNGIVNMNMKSNDFCLNPKHLRLADDKSKSMSHFDSEQTYRRNKYLTSLKRDEYLKQLNRINEEFVEKRNKKNNVLINNLMAFIRNNAIANDQDEKNSKKYSRLNENEQSNLRTSSKPNYKQKAKQITGSGLTRILRRLFLIYSFIQTQESDSQLQSVISKKNLDIFLQHFKIDIRAAANNNHKIKEIMEKQTIDQFQFIQFIHILSSMQSYHFQNSESMQDFIYTSINKWVAKRILHPSYEAYLSLEEERIIKKSMRKQFQKLRKLNRFQDKVLKGIQIFIEEERINKLMVPTLFEDFDYVLQILWFMKIYPSYVNKRTVRFYFEYLKEDKGSLVLSSLGMVSKNKGFAIIENIIWLVIAKSSKQELNTVPQKSESDFNQFHGNIVQIPRTLEDLFVARFRTINKVLMEIIEAKNNTLNHHGH